jgi:hypothetical protein
MLPRFPIGRLVAAPDFLANVPRSALVEAIRRHVTGVGHSPEGEVIRSDHSHGANRFYIVTEPCRQVTRIELADQE